MKKTGDLSTFEHRRSTKMEDVMGGCFSAAVLLLLQCWMERHRDVVPHRTKYGPFVDYLD
jgi:hypothetical protein